MNQILVVNNGEFEFASFNVAVVELENYYGFEGLAWEMVVASGDFEILEDFLNGDGLSAELVEEGAELW